MRFVVRRAHERSLVRPIRYLGTCDRVCDRRSLYWGRQSLLQPFLVLQTARIGNEGGGEVCIPVKYACATYNYRRWPQANEFAASICSIYRRAARTRGQQEHEGSRSHQPEKGFPSVTMAASSSHDAGSELCYYVIDRCATCCVHRVRSAPRPHI